jgi:hypothetical protein
MMLRQRIFLFAFAMLGMVMLITGGGLGRHAAAEPVYLLPGSPGASTNIGQVARDVMASRLSKAGLMVREISPIMKELGFALDGNRAAVLAETDVLQARLGSGFLIFVEYDELMDPATKGLSLRLAAQIYTTSNGFVANWTEPSRTLLLPENCSRVCLERLVLPEIEAQADSLSSSIVQLLKRPTGSSDGEAVPVQIYQVEMIDLDSDEMLELVDLMEHEFPGFVAITNSASRSPRLRFDYHTTASSQKLNDWLRISLQEIGIAPDRDADLQVMTGFITIKRYDSIESRGSQGNTVKFN